MRRSLTSILIHLLLAVLLVLFLLGLAPRLARARDCSSKLQNNLWEPRDFIALGAELRVFYLGARVGGGLPKSESSAGTWQHDPAGGLRLAVNLFPVSGLSVLGELDLSTSGSHVRPTQALVEYDAGSWAVTGGLQTLSFGSGALLDQRFIALDARLQTSAIGIEAFGGITHRLLMKSATNCIYVGYTAHTQGWRTLEHPLHENLAAGAVLSLHAVSPMSLQALYLLSWPGIEQLRSHAVALSLSGPILGQRLAFSLEPLMLVDHDQRALPGVVVQLRSRPVRGLNLKVGAAISFRRGEELDLSPVYENLSWAPLQRFTLHQGRVLMGRVSYRVHRFVKPFAGYAFRFQEASLGSENTGDELDAGVELRISNLYRLRASYIATNLAGPHAPSHAGFLELRLLMGAQLNPTEASR